MIRDFEVAEPHAEWLELCALATTSALQPAERDKLDLHLATCTRCRDALFEFQEVVREAGPLIAGHFTSERAEPSEFPGWNADRAKQLLFTRLDESVGKTPDAAGQSKSMRGPRAGLAALCVGLAAGLIIAVGLGSYQLGRHRALGHSSAPSPLLAKVGALSDEKVELNKRLIIDDARLVTLQKQTAQQLEQIANLRTKLLHGETQISEVTSAKSKSDQLLQSTAADRDDIAVKLQNTQQAYQTLQAELTTLRSQRQQDLLHYASLEVEVTNLNRRLHNAESTASSDTQFLASDRDIRELIGARQLYIADVMDVDQNGDRRKPFGRVFYTAGKSLIFYAFDLDSQPLKASSTYQAWAREGTDNARPISLGILYVDSEANRRWVLKTEDPKALAQINAVFVTVEPKGGSRKPTSKPFLYAYLHSVSPNHP
jgi:hypothetical protein